MLLIKRNITAPMLMRGVYLVWDNLLGQNYFSKIVVVALMV